MPAQQFTFPLDQLLAAMPAQQREFLAGAILHNWRETQREGETTGQAAVRVMQTWAESMLNNYARWQKERAQPAHEAAVQVVIGTEN